MDEKAIKTLIETTIKNELQSKLFTARKLGDTPTDNLSLVPRKYVNMNGTSAQRPTSSVIGQFYFDNTLGQPIWWDGTSFVDADGNVI